MIRWIVRVLGTLALVLGLAWSGWKLSNSRVYQLVGDLVTRVDTPDSIVALTFDDGPSPALTDSVLAVLDSLNVLATFFMVGDRMRDRHEVVERVAQAGHELANHSTTHPRLVLKSPRTIRREVEDTDALIRATTGQDVVYFRPPYGKRLLGLPLYLRRSGRPVVLWNLEPDTFHSDADGMVQYVVDRVVPGSIVLLHVELRPRAQERAALPRIITELQSRGYRFVTLSELMTAREST